MRRALLVIAAGIALVVLVGVARVLHGVIAVGRWLQRRIASFIAGES